MSVAARYAGLGGNEVIVAKAKHNAVADHCSAVRSACGLVSLSMSALGRKGTFPRVCFRPEADTRARPLVELPSSHRLVMAGRTSHA